jgi:NAD(P)-dependent dehydrogenase (short-subunit alcohol dehydrogenase family)
MVGQLEGKTAIVTGAARGVGLAIARRFYKAGANVILADSNEEAIQKEALALDETKERAISFRCDPTQRLDLNNLMAAAVDAFDGLDILIHTASVVAAGEALDLEESEFQRAFDVNVKSSFLLTQIVAKHMIKRAKDDEKKHANGAIVNVSALNSYSVIPNRFALGVSMAALDQLTRSFAVAFAEDGIRVNGIAPGGISGRFSGLSDPEARKAIVERTPMHRLGEPSEIADAALFLASDQASFITGQVIVADGGRSIFDMPMPESDSEGDK